MPDLIIGDHNYQQFAVDPVIDGSVRQRGLIPRDYSRFPKGHYRGSRAVDVPLIPRSEWTERIRDKIAQKSQLSNLRLDRLGGPAFSSLDQDGVGYCWGHSSTHSVMYLRLVQNQPIIPLSAFCVCATIKKGADEGGWGAQSMDFIVEKGICSQAIWPQGDRAYKTYDKSATWENAALHKVTEGFIDLDAAQYDRKLSFDQECSLLLSNIPVVKDENWWSHSILGVDVVDGNGQFGILRMESGKLATISEFELIWGINDPVTAGYGVRIQNSWSDSWGEKGLGVLTGSKAVSDGAVAPRATVPSDA